MLRQWFLAILLLVSIFSTFTVRAQECPASRLTPYHRAYIAATDGVAFYTERADDSTYKETIANGEILDVFITDQCIDGKLWVHVVYANSVGWVVEWDSTHDTYVIDPVIMPDNVITESGSISSVAWLPDGGLIFGTNSGVIQHGNPESTLIDSEEFSAVSTHPALPNFLATAAVWGLIRIYDLSTNEIQHETVYGFGGPDVGIIGNITAVVGFNEDASRVLIQTPDSVILLDTSTWQEVWSYAIPLEKSAYSPDGRWIAFAGYVPFEPEQPNLTQIQLLEVETGEIYGLSREDLATVIFSFRFSSDSQTLFAGDNKGNLQAWSVEDKTLTNIASTTLGDDEYRFINDIVDLPQDNLILVAVRTASFGSSDSDDEIVVYQDDGTLVGRWTTEQPFAGAYAIVPSPDGTQLAIILDNVVWVESVETFKANIHAE